MESISSYAALRPRNLQRWLLWRSRNKNPVAAMPMRHG